MNRKEFESEMGKARRMGRADIDPTNFRMGYARCIRRGYFGEKFGTDQGQVRWCGMA